MMSPALRHRRAGLLGAATLAVHVLFPLAALNATDVVAPTPAPGQASLFPTSAVTILDGPFGEALAAGKRYVLAHDPDRLLAPFLREAGLEPRRPSYGDWESIGLDGHTAGHYLSALAFLAEETGEAEFRGRLDHMVSELERCQNAAGDGYLGGIPGGRAFWKDLAAGKFKAGGFDINGKWVPWYNLHKTFAGLRDAALVAGSTKALEVWRRYGEWALEVTSHLSDEQMQQMLRAEHGGMNEVLADLGAATGDQRFLKLAARFEHQAVLGPLRHHEDKLNGLHANTQIPKVIGLLRLSRLTGDAQGASAAEFFWENVTGKRSTAFGGNSLDEHFNKPEDFSGMLAAKAGPETCNTYNLLRLTEQLFEGNAVARYADYYERALFNHILASLNTETPGLVYFTPIRPGHYRVYSKPGEHFWCCVGSGMENPGRYGAFIYTRAADGVHVNLFIASKLQLPDKAGTLTQATLFPDEPATHLRLDLTNPKTFTLHVRKPFWVGEGFAVAVNGKTVSTEALQDGYAAIRREWRGGDVVEVSLPMTTRLEPLPDRSGWQALLHGPILLAAKRGTEGLEGLRAGQSRSAHIPNGPLLAIGDQPVLLAPAETIPSLVKPLTGGGLRFRYEGPADPAQPGGIELIPFFRLHDARYQMYFEVTTPEAHDRRKVERAAAEKAAAEREARTLDSVRIGEQQPEKDHAFSGEDTDTGEHRGRRWRHGKAFSYALDTKGASEVDVVATFWGADRNRRFTLLAAGTVLAEVHLDGKGGDQFIEQRFRVPAAVLKALPAGQRLEIALKAAPGSLAGGLYGLRLEKPE